MGEGVLAMKADAETFVDVAVELLAAALKLAQHDVAVTGARTMPNGVIRLYLAGDHLPAGQVVVTYRQHVGELVVVESVSPA